MLVATARITVFFIIVMSILLSVTSAYLMSSAPATEIYRPFPGSIFVEGTSDYPVVVSLLGKPVSAILVVPVVGTDYVVTKRIIIWPGANPINLMTLTGGRTPDYEQVRLEFGDSWIPLTPGTVFAYRQTYPSTSEYSLTFEGAGYMEKDGRAVSLGVSSSDYDMKITTEPIVTLSVRRNISDIYTKAVMTKYVHGARCVLYQQVLRGEKSQEVLNQTCFDDCLNTCLNSGGSIDTCIEQCTEACTYTTCVPCQLVINNTYTYPVSQAEWEDYNCSRKWPRTYSISVGNKTGLPSVSLPMLIVYGTLTEKNSLNPSKNATDVWPYSLPDSECNYTYTDVTWYANQTPETVYVCDEACGYAYTCYDCYEYSVTTTDERNACSPDYCASTDNFAWVKIVGGNVSIRLRRLSSGAFLIDVYAVVNASYTYNMTDPNLVSDYFRVALSFGVITVIPPMSGSVSLRYGEIVKDLSVTYRARTVYVSGWFYTSGTNVSTTGGANYYYRMPGTSFYPVGYYIEASPQYIYTTTSGRVSASLYLSSVELPMSEDGKGYVLIGIRARYVITPKVTVTVSATPLG